MHELAKAERQGFASLFDSKQDGLTQSISVSVPNLSSRVYLLKPNLVEVAPYGHKGETTQGPPTANTNASTRLHCNFNLSILMQTLAIVPNLNITLIRAP